MARTKKTAQAPLTLEQIPAIPVEEQPYPLPKGWKWVRLGDVIFTSKEKTKNFSSSSLRYLGLEHLQKDRGITGWASALGIRSLKNIFHPGQILYGKLRPYLNKHDIPNFSGVCSTDILVFSCKNNVINKFINYFFDLEIFKEYIISKEKGINLPRVSENIILNFSFPLPPIDEQQRIVERIESLFSKLDEAREKVESMVESFEKRKAALLHKAFSGELTMVWRAKNNINKYTWSSVRFDNIAHIKSNLVNPIKFKKFPHIAPDNIEKKTGRLLEYHTIEDDGVTSQKHHFYSGQILYSKIRPYLSKAIIVNFEGLCSADMYPIESTENTKYLWYYILSEDFLEQVCSAGSRSVLPKINQKELSKIIIHRPSLPEQQEIVRILDELLAREERIKEAAEKTLERIDLMKKAILAKAFRGELGTNVHSDNNQ